MILRPFIASGAPIVPIFYDEAEHRVATQYLPSVLDGAVPADSYCITAIVPATYGREPQHQTSGFRVVAFHLTCYTSILVGHRRQQIE
jgi:hypothetical protein